MEVRAFIFKTFAIIISNEKSNISLQIQRRHITNLSKLDSLQGLTHAFRKEEEKTYQVSISHKIQTTILSLDSKWHF